MERKIAILGDGTMATAFAQTMASNGHEAVLVSPDPIVVESISTKRKHPQHFTQLVLADGVRATGNPASAIEGADLVVVAVRSERVRETIAAVKASIRPGGIILSATKGVERSTSRRMSEVILEEAPQSRVGVISGPNITHDIVAELPTAIIVASSSAEPLALARETIQSRYMHVFGSTDVDGVEWLSVLKNIIAVAVGLAANLGDNAKSYIVALGLAEIRAAAIALGARMETFGGLADVGEVFLSATSKHSRNHLIGVEVANGADAETVLGRLAANNETAEGVHAVYVSRDISARTGIDLPLASCVRSILFDGYPATETLRRFLEGREASSWLRRSGLQNDKDPLRASSSSPASLWTL